MEAYAVSWEAMISDHQSCADPLPPLDLQHKSDVTSDVKRLTFHALNASKRKSSPKHSIPTEVIATCLKPAWNLDAPCNVATLGLGISRVPSLCAPNTWAAFEK